MRLWPSARLGLSSHFLPLLASVVLSPWGSSGPSFLPPASSPWPGPTGGLGAWGERMSPPPRPSLIACVPQVICIFTCAFISNLHEAHKTPLWFSPRPNMPWISQLEFMYLQQGGRRGCFVLSICFSKVAANSVQKSCKNTSKENRAVFVKRWGSGYSAPKDGTVAYGIS